MTSCPRILSLALLLCIYCVVHTQGRVLRDAPSSSLTSTSADSSVTSTSGSSDHDQSTNPPNDTSPQQSLNSSFSSQPLNPDQVSPSSQPQTNKPPIDNNQNSTNEADDGGSNDDWKVAVGVVIPLLIVVGVVGAIVYFCYRKKYPVRMILGREFGKFSNPDYDRPKQVVPALVREDADAYFTNSGGESTVDLTSEYNPTSLRFDYDNPAFRKDEEDEEEKERRFIERKSWLFKKSATDDDQTDSQASSSAVDVANGTGLVREQRQGSEDLSDTDLSEVLGEQRLTPKPMPRRKGKGRKKPSPSMDSESSQDQNERNQSFSNNLTNQGRDKSESNASLSSKSKDTINDEKTPDASNRSASGFLQTVQLIFEQPSFEQVVEEVRARSRSMTVDYPSLQHSRMRALSVDTTKSARRQSLLGAIEHPRSGSDGGRVATLSEEVKRSFASMYTNTPASGASETGVEEPISPISASVVGIDIRERSGSSFVSSSSSSGESGSASNTDGDPGVADVELDMSGGTVLGDDGEDVPDGIALKKRSLSMASVNSNPHLITDLDEDTASESKTVAATPDAPSSVLAEGSESSADMYKNTTVDAPELSVTGGPNKPFVDTPTDDKKSSGSKLSQMFKRFRSQSSSKQVPSSDSVAPDDTSPVISVDIQETKGISFGESHLEERSASQNSEGHEGNKSLPSEDGVDANQDVQERYESKDSSIAPQQDAATLVQNNEVEKAESVSSVSSNRSTSNDSGTDNEAEQNEVSESKGKRKLRFSADDMNTPPESDSDQSDSTSTDGSDAMAASYSFGVSEQEETPPGDINLVNQSDNLESKESNDGLAPNEPGQVFVLSETVGTEPISFVASTSVADHRPEDSRSEKDHPVVLRSKQKLVSEIHLSDDSSDSSLIGGAEIKFISKSSNSVQARPDNVKSGISFAREHGKDSGSDSSEMSDAELSDILKEASSSSSSSSCDSEDGGLEIGQSSGVYKFASDESEDDDIDV